MEGKNTKKPLFDDIDLLQLVGKLLNKWKLIVKVSICFAVFGVVVALSSIKQYTSQVVVAPETATSDMGGGLASLASFAGINMSVGGDAIYPLLYPDIIRSLPFLCSLLDVQVQSLDGSVDTTYSHYMKSIRKKSWMSKVKNFPKKCIGKFLSLFKEKTPGGNPLVFDPYRLSEKQVAMIKQLDASIGVVVDMKTEVITLSFTDQDPQIAAMMVDTIKQYLQERITEYRTKKAIADCEYIEKLYIESKSEYEKAQDTYAEYVDRNRNVTQERFLVEKERLAADRDLKNSLYMQWAQQLQLAKAKVQEYTPAFTTLKPASIPALPSSMSRSMMVILFTFLGGVLSVAYILLKDSIVDVWHKLFGKK
jgi:uncharacterized protein involved in exopolysaccharide biosynthesis